MRSYRLLYSISKFVDLNLPQPAFELTLRKPGPHSPECGQPVQCACYLLREPTKESFRKFKTASPKSCQRKTLTFAVNSWRYIWAVLKICSLCNTLVNHWMLARNPIPGLQEIGYKYEQIFEKKVKPMMISLNRWDSQTIPLLSLEATFCRCVSPFKNAESAQSLLSIFQPLWCMRRKSTPVGWR